VSQYTPQVEVYNTESMKSHYWKEKKKNEMWSGAKEGDYLIIVLPTTSDLIKQ
jgi:hypothetical protein